MSNDICKFCGQVLMADIECDCKEAKQARRIEDQIERAKKAAVEIFGKDSIKQGYSPVPDECMEIINSAMSKLLTLKFTLSPLFCRAVLRLNLPEVKVILK